MLEYGEARGLLAEGLSPEGEAALLESDTPLAACVLPVPGHGDESEDDGAFLEAVGPQLAVIPGEGDRSPHEATLEDNGVPVYRTGQEGTVHVATDGARLWVWPRRQGS